MHIVARFAFAFASCLGFAAIAQAACVDNVVLVHGNSGSPPDFDNTYVELRARGYTDAQILLPDWGSKTCAACNDHSGSEETPVANALNAAIAASCTGKIDVIGHSMGVTLLAREIVKLNPVS
ncbi:MAG TPA: alpha/beta fold hydrolase, partial [Tahibacter sp.]|nr:alpha/beta fold hydrolase [Tahibacter sp.]